MLLLSLACAPPPLPEVEEDTTPHIRVVWPEPDAEVVACTLVIVELENLQIRLPDSAGKDAPDAPGEGHWHAYWSDTYTGSYIPYLLADFSNEPPGEYQITAELEQNQHEPMLDDDGLRILDTVSVVVEAGTCDASLDGLD
jgi:hypothetical protein